MRANDVVTELGGIATRAQLRERGLSGGDLTAAVRLGLLRRIRRAHYAVPGASPDAVLAVRVGGRLGGVSAARTFGLWSGFDDRIHIVLPVNASRLRTNFSPSMAERITPDSLPREIVLHWIGAHGAECWRVARAECLRQVLDWSDSETAVACLDTARTAFRLTSPDIVGLGHGMSAAGRARIAQSRPGSDSGGESVVRQRLAALNILVDQQVSIPGVGRVDMVVRDSRVVIEIDGRAFHNTATTFENDRRRDAELAARGYVVIRLTYERIFGDWPWCRSTIRAALSQFRNV
jgi:very-short-patch-repair endonuclease